MYSVVTTAILQGIDARLVSAEADVGEGLPCMEMVGFLAGEVRESKERIRTALKNSGIQIPAKRLTINLAPADIKKTGSGLDLPIALAVLGALELFSDTLLKDTVVVGELHLDGSIAPVKGVLPIVLEAAEAGKTCCIVPRENLAEAQLPGKLNIIAVSSLRETIAFLRHPKETERKMMPPCEPEAEEQPDFAEVAGQQVIRRACEIAVSGMHNFLMIGPPGAGKSMIARRIAGILPPLLPDERLEVSKIYSVCGMLGERKGLIANRPFRAPHHTISAAGLSGGGAFPRPGEISLAHRGVLFLDELPEFSPAALEILRQPLEERRIRISRVGYQVEYPADVLLVAAMNPCKCGYYPSDRCTCTQKAVSRYQSRISRPLLDRVDITARAEPVRFSQIEGDASAESSGVIRGRVCRAQQIQQRRFQGMPYHFNAQIPPGEIGTFCRLEEAERAYMASVYDKYELSARSYHKILKVARTIADMDGEESIRRKHLMEALCYRGMEGCV